MELQPVELSMLAAVGYDSQAKVLMIQFRDGRTYQYLDIPADVYQALMKSLSKGRFMRRNIIGFYPYISIRSRRG